MSEKIKQEPMEVVLNLETEDRLDDEGLSSPKSVSDFGMYSAMYETIKAAASVNKKRRGEELTKMEKKRKTESVVDDEDYPRSDMCPDRTMSDFYCNICDAHMNSEQMWESHVSGKRHLKNVKKEPGEMPSKVKAIKVQSYPKLMDAIKEVHEPLVGLGFMTELQRSDPCLNPSYTCHLCQANCTWSVVIEHVLSTKHRLAYLKAVDPNEHEIIENMELKKISLDQLAEDRAREYERKRGCGTMEVKLEKPKVAPPPPKREKGEDDLSVGHHSRSLSEESRHERHASPEDFKDYVHERRKRSRSPSRYHSPPPYRHKRHVSPVEGKWRHDQYSPEASPPRSSRVPHCSSSNALPSISSLGMQEKLHILRQLAQDMIAVSEMEVKEIKAIIASLSTTVLHFRIRQLPLPKQNRLAKCLAKCDSKSFAHELQPALEFVYDAVSAMTSSPHRRHKRSSSSSSKKRLY